MSVYDMSVCDMMMMMMAEGGITKLCVYAIYLIYILYKSREREEGGSEGVREGG